MINTMTIEQSLDFIRDRLVALFPGYRVEVCRIRGIGLTELPFINVLLSDQNEDDDSKETVSYAIDIMTAGAPAGSNPGAIDRQLFQAAIANARRVKHLLRSGYFAHGQTVVDGNIVQDPNGQIGVANKINVTYDPDPRPEMIVMHTVISFDIAGFIEYVDDEPDGGYADFEAIDASIDTGGPVTTATWQMEQET